MIYKFSYDLFFYLGSGGGTDGKTVGIIVGSVVGGVILLLCLKICCCYGGYRAGILKGRPLRSNSTYVNNGTAIQYNMSKQIFISGTFVSYYEQYKKLHGPFNINLGFHPQAGHIVHGAGIDNIGAYTITGVYSPRTLRMGLEKNYQRGAGNPSENLGHKVTIQVEWNPIN